MTYLRVVLALLTTHAYAPYLRAGLFVQALCVVLAWVAVKAGAAWGCARD